MMTEAAARWCARYIIRTHPRCTRHDVVALALRRGYWVSVYRILQAITRLKQQGKIVVAGRRNKSEVLEVRP